MSHTSNTEIDKNRKNYLKVLHEKRGRNVVAYYSGFWLNREDADILEDDIGAMLDVVQHLDPSQGLDLLLHTPGGVIEAAEAIGNYLRGVFGTDIEVFVPMTAMSAGTMIACASRKIHMGKQSSLGPIDPQIDGSVGNFLDGIELAYEKMENPSQRVSWSDILKEEITSYGIGFIPRCEKVVELSKEIVSNWLKTGMFCEDGGANVAECVTKKLSDYKEMKSHDRKISIGKAEKIGLKVVDMGEDKELEELVLDIHRAYIATLSASEASKIIENHNGIRRLITPLS